MAIPSKKVNTKYVCFLFPDIYIMITFKMLSVGINTKVHVKLFQTSLRGFAFTQPYSQHH